MGADISLLGETTPCEFFKFSNLFRNVLNQFQSYNLSYSQISSTLESHIQKTGHKVQTEKNP